jgi:hypothetical protein
MDPACKRCILLMGTTLRDYVLVPKKRQPLWIWNDVAQKGKLKKGLA